MKPIYLIRHAEPFKFTIEYKTSESIQLINEKIPLSVQGEEQAKKLSYLEEIKNLDMVISSNYVRALATAKYFVNDNTKLVIDSSFAERKMGTENKDKNFWLTQLYDENAKTIDGESQKEVRMRMLNSINKILLNEEIKRCAIFTHATAITFLLMNWCKLEDANLEGKTRKLSFKGKTIIDGVFKTPEIFKLLFDERNNLIDISRIIF